MLDSSKLPGGITPTAVAGAALASGFVYFLWTCFYNLYLHPLRKIPGPKLAAIGPYLEFYHEVIRDGQYLWELEKMHEKYGPIVRVNQREVHIKDSSYYSTIYTAGSRKTNKDAATVGAFDVPTATAATVDHDLHRTRRGYLNPYFSKRAIQGIEPMVHERITKMLSRFDEFLKSKTTLSLDGIFSALTADVITSRFYGNHHNLLSSKDFHFVVRDGFIGLTKVYHLARFLPSIVLALKALPKAAIHAIMPPVADLLQMREDIHANGINQFNSERKTDTKASVLVAALADPNIPPADRTITRMLDEGTVFLFAGTETTSRSLSVTMFYLLSNPDKLQKMREELDTLPPAQDNIHSLTELEALPYLTGVVHEGLRLAFGPISRSSRVATKDNLQYGEYTIPAGTPVSQSTYFIHTDPEIYPDPWAFKPERWIEAAEKGIPLSKYITNFSKGSRQCIGYSMTFAELYMTLSRIVRAYDLELFETTKDDLDLTHARIVGFPKTVPGKTEGLGEIRVKVTKRL